MHLSCKTRVVLAHIRQLEEVDMIKGIVFSLITVIIGLIFIALDQEKVEAWGVVTVTNGVVTFSPVTNMVGKASPMWVYQADSNAFWGFIRVVHPDKLATLKHRFPYQVKSFTTLGDYQIDIPFYIPGNRMFWSPRERKLVPYRNGPCVMVVEIRREKITEFMRYD